MALSIRAVVFDIGGVLCDTPATHWEARWARRLHITEADLTNALRDVSLSGTLGLMTRTEVEAETARLLGLESGEATELMEDLWTEYLGTANEALMSCLVSLRPRFRTALLSNSFVGAREREQVAYDFASRCDLVVYSHEVRLPKPDPAIYALVGARLCVEPAEIFFVDDAEENVAAAIAARWKAIQFLDIEQVLSEMADVLAK